MFLDRLYQSGIIKHKMFSVYFTNFYISEKAAGSKLMFGGYNLNKYAKNPADGIKWSPLIHEFYWMIEMSKPTLTGPNIYPFAMMNASTQVIIDTGTSLINMPSPDFETIKYFFDKGLGLPLQKYSSVHKTPCTDE